MRTVVERLLLLVLLTTLPLMAKTVVCVDGAGDRYVNNAEGYWRAKLKGQQAEFDVGGNLKDCLAKVKDGDCLVIIAHGFWYETEDGQTDYGFTWGGTDYYGFGDKEGEACLPDGFDKLKT